MKKFRFLVFMLILTSIFIGCAQPTDDTVIPEVPKTTNEAEPTDEELYSSALLPAGSNSYLFRKNFTIKSSNRKFTINTTLLGKIWPIEYLNEEYKIRITDFTDLIVSISVETSNTAITNDIKAIITNNIKQIYIEVK